MHVYVWEHIVSFYYRTAQWMFKEIGKDEVPAPALRCFGLIRPGEDPGRAKIGHEGSPSSTNFFFRLEGYSNKPNA